MISDPKLPLARTSTGLPELQPQPQAPEPETARDSASRPQPSALHIWLRRVGVLFFVFLCATIGVMMMILPWRTEWAENHLLMRYPTLLTIFASGFTRGVCTGLGVLNVWIGFWEAIQYRED
ncbi:MAG: hypothetical protein HY010_13770 [Acidobacteria bacterium]|nr:hypothetical protein [Acidobacteriota bacterium]